MSQERLYTIKELSEIVGISKQAIYKALNQKDNQLNKYLKIIDNQKMIRESALYEVYGIKEEQPNDKPVEQPETNKFNDKLLELLQSQIELYKTQLEQKDKQIEQLQKLLENEQKLRLENSPKLLEVMQGVEDPQQEQATIVPEQKQPEETTQAAGIKSKKLFSWFKRK